MEVLQLKLLWANLIGLRFLITIMPQYGFLNTEEFTESPQVMAEILGLTDKRENLEIAGLAFPFLSSGIPFVLLRIMDNSRIFGNIITPYSVLVTPRIWMTLCSIFIDVYIYKTAVNCGCSRKRALSAMIMFASSYISLVYFTRTLPISFIAIIYAALLHITTKNIALSNVEQKKSIIWSSFETLNIAILTGLGMSLDARFINYAILPVCFWFVFSGASFSERLAKLLFFLYCFFWVCFFVFLVSVPCLKNLDNVRNILNKYEYYGVIKLLLKSPTVSDSLKLIFENEVEPFYLIPKKMFLLSMHILFNIYGPVLMVLFREICSRSFFTKLRTSRHDALLLIVVFQPVLEAIILKQPSENAIYVMIIPIAVLVAKHTRLSKIFHSLCAVFNVAYLLYFAVYKHGGAVHSMEFFGSVMNTAKHIKEMEIVFYETPMLPHYLTARQCEMDVDGACVGHNGARLHFTEANIDTLQLTLDSFLLQDREPLVFLVIHSSLSCKFLQKLHILYDLHLFYKYFPHMLSTVDIPDLSDPKEWCNSKGGEIDTLTELVEEKFALNIYGVSRPKRHKRPEIRKMAKLTLVIDSYSSSI